MTCRDCGHFDEINMFCWLKWIEIDEPDLNTCPDDPNYWRDDEDE